MLKIAIAIFLCFLAGMNSAATSEEIIFDTLNCKFNLTTNQDRPQSFLFNSCSWQKCHLWKMTPQSKKCANQTTIQSEANWQNCMHHCCGDRALGYSFETLNKCYYSNKPTDAYLIFLKTVLAVLILAGILFGIITYYDCFIPKRYKNSLCSLCNKPGVNLVFDSCGTHYFHRECMVSNPQKTRSYYCPTCSTYSFYYSLYCKTCGYKKEKGYNYQGIFKDKTDFCSTCAIKDKKE